MLHALAKSLTQEQGGYGRFLVPRHSFSLGLAGCVFYSAPPNDSIAKQWNLQTKLLDRVTCPCVTFVNECPSN